MKKIPKRCNDVCFPICDFCRYYNFNPGKGGVYLGKGYCVLYEENREPDDECKYFICINYKMISDHTNSRKIVFFKNNT